VKHSDIDAKRSGHSLLRFLNILILIILSIISACVSSEAEPAQKNQPSSKLGVEIAPPKARVRSGESLLLHVQIRNETTESVYIGTAFDGTDNALTRLNISILHEGSWSSASADRSVGDYVLYAPDRKPPLIEEFSKYWLALPPNHSYGGDFVLRPSSYPWLNRPAKYMIRGIYVSDGFLNAGMNNPLASYLDELSRLPYKPFVGEIETNHVQLEVVPATSSKVKD